MSDAVWYYAHGDKEQGPVTLAQLKGLLSSGKIQSDDLVWKDGLADWTAAENVPELRAVETPISPPASTAKAKTPSEAAPRIEAPARPPGGPGANPTPPPATPPPPSEATPARRPARTSTGDSSISPSGASVEPRKIVRWAGWGLAIFGLFLALTTKGCASLGQRYAASVRAAVDAGASGYETKDATSAAANYRMWSLEREVLFLFGALVLVAGLLTNGIGGEGTEKWLCLVMLAIITYSLFVSGAAWGP